jgi:hypothetical protein
MHEAEWLNGFCVPLTSRISSFMQLEARHYTCEHRLRAAAKAEQNCMLN